VTFSQQWFLRMKAANRNPCYYQNKEGSNITVYKHWSTGIQNYTVYSKTKLYIPHEPSISEIYILTHLCNGKLEPRLLIQYWLRDSLEVEFISIWKITSSWRSQNLTTPTYTGKYSNGNNHYSNKV
jgi:hypothetical protein